MSRPLGRVLLILLVGLLTFALPLEAQTPDEKGGVEQTVLFENPSDSTFEMPMPSGIRSDPHQLLPGTTAAPPAWYGGSYAYQGFPNCASQSTGTVISEAGQWMANDGSYPLVGQIYLVRIVMAVSGNICSGGVAESNETRLPAGTFLAVSQQNPVKCYFLPNGAENWVDATNDPDANCPHNPGQGITLPISLGTRTAVNYTQFQIQIPVYSTRVLSGIGDSSNSTLTMMAYSLSTTPNQVFPSQWVWVFDNPPTIDTLQTVNITDTSARTQGWVRNHYKAGNVYFDLGETTDYGATAGPYALANTYDSASVYQDWNLSPGTTYHWRIRFVPTSGTTVTSADQVFTTTGTASLAAPSGLVAYAISTSHVFVTWLSVSGATSYEVFRSSNNLPYSPIGSPTPYMYFNDTMVSGSTTYLYKVRALAGASTSGLSNADAATTIVFADDPLVEASTPVRVIHLTELRTAVNAMRAAAGLPPLAADPSVAAGSPVLAQHFADLRAGLAAARATAGLPIFVYADTTLTPGSTLIKAVHVLQLRDAVN